MVINMSILFGAMSLFGFTLTMPGIAGLVLTIGMAVDANVLIFERLREDMEAGKTLSAALDAAYEKAFSAIADSNITTLISAVILFAISGGLVKGFAITLMIGLISSMIGALIVTRVIFIWVVDKNLLQKITTTKLIPDKVFDILSASPRFIIASLVVTAISFATLGYKGQASLGIDFRGGGRVDVVLAPGKDIPDGEFDALIKPLKQPGGKDIGTHYIQRKSDPATGATNISIRCVVASGPVRKVTLQTRIKTWTRRLTDLHEIHCLCLKMGIFRCTRPRWTQHTLPRRVGKVQGVSEEQRSPSTTWNWTKCVQSACRTHMKVK
jgi:SecD/SecF fusion protein